MPLKSNAEVKLSVWIIHTHRPFYRIMRAELDPDTKSLMDDKKKGAKTLENNPLASRFVHKYLAAESLEYDPSRAENMTWAMADEHGDFILEDGFEALDVWEMVRRDPEPKPYIDPKSPPLPVREAKKPEAQK